MIFTHCSPPSSPMSLTLSSPAIVTQAGNANIASLPTMGSKRGRLLIRQQRVKKDGDQAGDLETPDAGIYSEYLLSVPSSGARMERHASEPAPSSSSGLITSSSMSGQSLLSVPSHSYLIKQHSHPLLPSQSPGTTYTLTRQLSHPVQTSTTSQSTLAMTTEHDVQSSGEPVVQYHHHKMQVRSHTMPHYSVSDLEMGTDKNQHIITTSGPTVVIIPSDTMGDQQQPAHQKQSHHHLQLPSIRVKSEELQRSISSPLVS